jgi:sarcosine oxidase, subunit gamma
VSWRELPFLAQLNLRGEAEDETFAEAVAAALGCPLPREPNTVTDANSLHILWLGPDEWIVIGPPDTEWQIAAVLNEALAGRHVSVVDISASRTVLELAGSRARELLAKGCGLDLHPRSFTPGRCAQTLLAKANVILHQTSGTPVYRLSVRNSFARYLAAWLQDAAAEYGPAAALA